MMCSPKMGAMSAATHHRHPFLEVKIPPLMGPAKVPMKLQVAHQQPCSWNPSMKPCMLDAARSHLHHEGCSQVHCF